VSNPIPPTGIIPRVEPQRKHFEFLDRVGSVHWVMLDIDLAERLVRQSKDASVFGRGISVITTSTIADLRIVHYHLGRELDVVRKFHPAWHIPCDRPVYDEQNPAERKGFIEDGVQQTLEFVDRIRDTQTGVIPLIKGVNADEWRLCFRPMSQAGLRYFAYYGSQYRGWTTRLLRDVAGIVTVCGMEYILLIGLQSVRFVRKLPPQVQALAGQKWWRESELGNQELEESIRLFDKWRREVESALPANQRTLDTA